MPSAIPYFLCQCQKAIILKSEKKVPRMSTQCTVQPLLMIRNHHPWEIAGLIPHLAHFGQYFQGAHPHRNGSKALW
jgi:hypothetical protein